MSISPETQAPAVRRAIELLRVVSQYAPAASEYLPSRVDVAIYDGAECDGQCLGDDCGFAADALEAAFGVGS